MRQGSRISVRSAEAATCTLILKNKAAGNLSDVARVDVVTGTKARPKEKAHEHFDVSVHIFGEGRASIEQADET